MVTVRLPTAGASLDEALAVQRRLQSDHAIAAAIVAQAGALWVRIAAQAYNERADYERLAGALADS
jgi:isopenicillin-N epimerase